MTWDIRSYSIAGSYTTEVGYGGARTVSEKLRCAYCGIYGEIGKCQNCGAGISPVSDTTTISRDDVLRLFADAKWDIAKIMGRRG